MQRLLSTRIASLNSRDLNSTPIYHDDVFPDLTSRISFDDNAKLDQSQGSADAVKNKSGEQNILAGKPVASAPVTKHTLSESVVLVPTPLIMSEDRNNDGNVGNEPSVEFYLATLRIRANSKNVLQLTGSADSTAHSTNKYSLEDITLQEKSKNRLVDA